MWDAGSAPSTVIEHGIIDPGPLWTGELERAAVAVNEPLRRGRTTGTDLLPAFAEAAPLDVFGMGTEGLADRLGPVRWTSLGLSLLEAMHLGMPVVALATTEVTEAVPPGAGVVSNRIDELTDAVRNFMADPLHARMVGEGARAAVLARYGLSRFLDDWERLLKEVAR